MIEIFKKKQYVKNSMCLNKKLKVTAIVGSRVFLNRFYVTQYEITALRQMKF